MTWTGLCHAQTGWEDTRIDPFSPESEAAAIGGLFALTSGVTFAVADVVVASHREWLPPGWAIPQIVLAGVPITFAGVATVTLSAQSDGELVPLGGLLTATGLFFTAHGALSLVHYEKPRSRIAVALVPVPSGGATQLWGEF